MKSGSSFIIPIIVTILLLVVQASFWYSRQILDPTNFTKAFTEGITHDESKRALSSEIVDRGLEKRPLIKEFLGDTATSAIYSLFETRYFQSGIERLAANTQKRLTSPDNADLTINIATVKAIALPLITQLRPALAENLEGREIPDKIVIIRQADVPQLHRYTPPILWAGWLSFMGTLILLGYYFYSGYKNGALDDSLRTLGIVMAIGFIIALISVITLQPLITAGVASSNLRIVAENVTQAFLALYTRQLLILTFASIIVLGLGYIYPLVFKTSTQGEDRRKKN